MTDSTETVYPDNLKVILPVPHLTAIGRVCVQWGALENIVDLSIRKLSGFDLTDPRPAVLTAHMAWPLKMDVLASLVAFYRSDFPQLKRFDRIGPILKKAQSGRNKIVHASWIYEDEKAYILRATARGELKTSITPVSVEQIETIVDDIGTAGAALLKMIVNK